MKEINKGSSNTTIFAVTGNPILHSKSPVIFNDWFKQLNLNAVYTRLATDSAGEAIKLFNELGLSGMNVTAPFKKTIIHYLDWVDIAALKIGGVNTIVRAHQQENTNGTNNSVLRGYNTDYIGVLESLKQQGINVAGKRCLVLGAGGAGRAAVYGLMKEKADVTIINRTYEKAENAAGDLGCKSARIIELEKLLADAYLLISTLSSTVNIIPAHWLSPELIVFDANYKSSPLIENAQSAGCRTIKGEQWLQNQALPAFIYFFPNYKMIPPPSEPPLSNTEIHEFQGDLSKNFRRKKIALVGFMGSGKTHIGKEVALQMGFSFVDLDERIEEEAGQSVAEIFKNQGEMAFREMEKEILKNTLQENGDAVISCGGGILTDTENLAVLKKHALVIWIYSTLESTLKRLEPGTRPLLDCRAPEKKATELLKKRLPYYAQAADLVIYNEHDAKQTVEKINEEINKAFKN